MLSTIKRALARTMGKLAGNPPEEICTAIKNDKLDECKRLLTLYPEYLNGCKLSDTDKQEAHRNVPLIAAVCYENIDAIVWLLQKGANPLQEDAEETTAVSLAYYSNRQEALKTLCLEARETVRQWFQKTNPAALAKPEISVLLSPTATSSRATSPASTRSVLLSMGSLSTPRSTTSLQSAIPGQQASRNPSQEPTTPSTPLSMQTHDSSPGSEEHRFLQRVRHRF